MVFGLISVTSARKSNISHLSQYADGHDKEDHDDDEADAKDDDDHALGWTWLITGCQRIKGGADFSLLAKLYRHYGLDTLVGTLVWTDTSTSVQLTDTMDASVNTACPLLTQD